MQRRKFLRKSGSLGLGFLGLKVFALSCNSKELPSSESALLSHGYGPLINDPKGILNLPKDFSYKIISKVGDHMSDGLLLPGLADGMATFEGDNGKVIVVRNHEVSPRDYKNGAFGNNQELLGKIASKSFYDFGRGKSPCLGGTTTFIYNPKSNEIEDQWFSLAGTIRNCAGGKTPWNTWISCEETNAKAGDILEKDHGYNFEVPANTSIKTADPIPLIEMGRFNHEAVCVDPKSSIVYQTEDRSDGLIYRYIPNTKGELHSGGKLQVLVVPEQPKFDTRNWKTKDGVMELGKKYPVTWIDIDKVESPDDDLRYRGADMGAAIFARGEGMWFGNNEFYFACTNGGKKGNGQVFRYTPSPDEGTNDETKNPAVLDLFVESENSDILESCDNLTIASNGDLILCEDKSSPKIVGVTPEGKMYHFAKNVGYRSEFAGATFSPDGQVLFVNIQGPGLTLAIRGPWDYRKNS